MFYFVIIFFQFSNAVIITLLLKNLFRIVQSFHLSLVFYKEILIYILPWTLDGKISSRILYILQTFSVLSLSKSNQMENNFNEDDVIYRMSRYQFSIIHLQDEVSSLSNFSDIFSFTRFLLLFLFVWRISFLFYNILILTLTNPFFSLKNSLF